MRRNDFSSFNILIWLILIIVFGFTSVSAVFNESASNKLLADEVINSSGISFSPKVNCKQLQLFIARPDGTVFSKTFPGGSQPYVDLSSICAANSCDGPYTYELRVIPLTPKKIRGEELTEGTAPIQQENLSQTGHFLVQNGSIVNRGNTENMSRVLDVVHADDVIITNSLCVGFDCLTDGTENFGFDTIKLKENNLQIYFDDTSTTGGYPANDWRIVCNDSASGGGNYFSVHDSTAAKVPFKIEAGARTSALYVNSSGRVGLGTSTPVLNLHTVSGDTPSMRLDQDTSSGWTAQVWDISGNESNFFIRDTTGGSKLPFRIQPGTPTSTLTLKADGKVGVGTWSPTAQFHIEKTGENAAVIFNRTDGAMGKFTARPSEVYLGSGSNHNVQMVANNTVVMTITPTTKVGISNTSPTHMLDVGSSGAYCNGGAWIDGSSRLFKNNIKNLNYR